MYAGKTVSMIAAMAENRVIADGSELPWDVPEDRKLFMEMTLGHPVIMGRKTWETLPEPLSGRVNIVVTRQVGLKISGARVVNSLEQALELAAGDKSGEIFITGGGEIYRLGMAYADRIYLSVIGGSWPGDVFFPEIPADEFRLAESRSVKAAINFQFRVYERR